MIGSRHTKALHYSRWERLVFRLTGRWPDSVVERRLAASDADQREWLEAAKKQDEAWELFYGES